MLIGATEINLPNCLSHTSTPLHPTLPHPTPTPTTHTIPGRACGRRRVGRARDVQSESDRVIVVVIGGRVGVGSVQFPQGVDKPLFSHAPSSRHGESGHAP